MHGGALLAVRASEFVSFFDWETRMCVRRIDVVAEDIFWNQSGDMLAIVCKDSVFMLKYHCDIMADALASGVGVDEDGVQEAFVVITEVRFPLSSIHSCVRLCLPYMYGHIKYRSNCNPLSVSVLQVL